MKKFLQIALLLLMSPAWGDSPHGIALAIMQNCDPGHICVEPFFTPTFDVKVVAGEWPGKGDIECRGVGTELHCGNGLRLTIERIRFH